MAFMLSSPDIAPQATISAPFVYGGCGGGNRSPALRWSGAPAGTQSFAVTVYDPDAPTGSGWWHWLIYNLPANLGELAAGAGAGDGQQVPKGSAQGINDYGERGYGGPCPPPGDRPHRYLFTIFALKIAHLELPASASGAMIGFNLNANALATASFTGRYGR